jgi:hypothetical protein
MERQYKNLGFFLFILVAFVAAGFYKPYFSLIPHFDPGITPLVQVHPHMRSMIAVVLIVAPAGIARVLGYWFEVPRYASGLASNALLDAVLIALILFDRRKHLNYRPYMLVLALFVLSHAAFAVLARPVAPS